MKKIENNSLETKELFSWSEKKPETKVVALSKHQSAVKEAMKEIFSNKLAFFGLLFFIAMIITSIIAPMVSQWDITVGDDKKILQGSSAEHWFGTDSFGRDVWTRLWYGVSISALLAIISSSINVTIATLIGISAGYFKKFDLVSAPFIKILYSLPAILILILFSVVFGSSFQIMILSLVITGWVGPSQQIRGQTLRIRNQDFIIASQTLGTGKFKIFGTFFNLAIPTIIIQFSMLFPRMILAEATLGFLGLSIPDTPTIGTMINDGREYILTHPMQVFYPIISLVSLVGSLQFFSFGLEKAFGSSRTGR